MVLILLLLLMSEVIVSYYQFSITFLTFGVVCYSTLVCYLHYPLTFSCIVYKFEPTLEYMERQRIPVCRSPWGRKESDMT